MSTELAAQKRLRIGYSPWIRRSAVGASLVLLGVLLVMPLLTVFVQAFAKGLEYYGHAIAQPDTWHAVRITLIATAISVPVNVVFGVAAAWCLTRFSFPGKSILLTLIDLPFSISPVVSGLVFVLMFGLHGFFRPVLDFLGLEVLYALPGIVIATVFVTFPFVAREVIPVMQEVGSDEELASLVLGAGGWRTFWKITLPNIRWGLLYGIILCTARAMGEFGAVSVVSGHIGGETMTIPLQVETLYNDYDAAGAFAVATLLASLSVITLIAKKWVERRIP